MGHEGTEESGGGGGRRFAWQLGDTCSGGWSRIKPWGDVGTAGTVCPAGPQEAEGEARRQEHGPGDRGEGRPPPGPALGGEEEEGGQQVQGEKLLES